MSRFLKGHANGCTWPVPSNYSRKQDNKINSKPCYRVWGHHLPKRLACSPSIRRLVESHVLAWLAWECCFLCLRVGGCLLNHQGDAECLSSASWETCTGSVWARGSIEEHNQFTVGSHLWHLFNHISCIYQDLCYIYIFINYLFLI